MSESGRGDDSVVVANWATERVKIATQLGVESGGREIEWQYLKCRQNCLDERVPPVPSNCGIRTVHTEEQF